jgi:2-oxoglutarate dehydrogenase E2 component (dihydrolipoamide succinyltransferase)
MIIEIKIPSLPESVADATIAAWRANIGEPVARDDIILDVETDKIVLEVPAPDAGQLVEILYQEGDTVLADQIVAKFEVGAAQPVASAEIKAASTPAPAAPAAPAPAAGAGKILEIQVPSLPESVSEATIALWRAAVGDTIARDDILVDIETDKIILEVPAPESGVLVEIVAKEGETVLANQLIARFQTGAMAAAPSPAASASAPPSIEQSDDLSPSVRRLVAEHSIDMTQVKGTGVGGRITKADVEALIGRSASTPTSAPTAAAPVARQQAMAARDERRVPMTRLRKRIAERLLDVKQSTAMLTTFNEVNMKPIMELRKQYQESFEKHHDIRLGFMSFYVKAVTEALKRFPEINASLDGDDIVYHNYFDISMAISTPRGLVTPVMRNCDQMSFAEIEQGIRDFAAKGRDGKLGLDDLQGGNFTITNGGVFGSLMSTPIINPPQSAILGMHAIQDRPMAVNGEVVILPMMYLALSYDHRIVDGKESVSFLVAIKEMLEDPARMLLQI